MGAAVAGIAGSLLSSAAQSGDKSKMGEGNVAGSNGNIANSENQAPDIKTADVEKAAETAQTPTPAPEAKTGGTGSGVDWADVAKKAGEWYDSNSSGGQSQMMTAGNVSQPGQIANFR